MATMLIQTVIGIGMLIVSSGVTMASDCASKIDPKSATFVVDLLTCVRSLEEENNELNAKVAAAAAFSAFPAGAVIAFDLPDGCPRGWKPFERGASRTIIGASAAHTEQIKNVDSEGKQLKSYPYQADGGIEYHILSIDELPPVRASTNGYSAVSNKDRYNAGGKDYPVVEVGSPIQTEPLGKGKGFSLMPPYIALFLCKEPG